MVAFVNLILKKMMMMMMMMIRFDAVTHRRLADITVKDMSDPWDIAACQQTAQL